MAVLDAKAIPAPRSDEELMAAYVAGDPAAFGELYERYAPQLVRWLASGLPQHELSDLVQQTFLQLHRSRRDFRSDASLRPWLFAIALNVKRQHLRKLMRRRELPLGLEGRNAIAAVTAHVSLEQASAALEALPQQQREVLELHCIEGHSFRTVAELVGATVGAVKVRAHRGYVNLRRRFAPEGRSGSSTLRPAALSRRGPK